MKSIKLVAVLAMTVSCMNLHGNDNNEQAKEHMNNIRQNAGKELVIRGSGSEKSNPLVHKLWTDICDIDPNGSVTEQFTQAISVAKGVLARAEYGINESAKKVELILCKKYIDLYNVQKSVAASSEEQVQKAPPKNKVKETGKTKRAQKRAEKNKYTGLPQNNLTIS